VEREKAQLEEADTDAPRRGLYKLVDLESTKPEARLSAFSQAGDDARRSRVRSLGGKACRTDLDLWMMSKSCIYLMAIWH